MTEADLKSSAINMIDKIGTIAKTVGAPGDYGYESPAGIALYALYQCRPIVAAFATQAAEIERLRGEVERLAEAGDVMVDWHRQMSPTAKFKRPAHVDAALQVFRNFWEDQRHG